MVVAAPGPIFLFHHDSTQWGQAVDQHRFISAGLWHGSHWPVTAWYRPGPAALIYRCLFVALLATIVAANPVFAITPASAGGVQH